MTSRPGLRDSGDSQLPSIPIVITPRRESPHRMRQPKQQPKKPAEGAEFFSSTMQNTHPTSASMRIAELPLRSSLAIAAPQSSNLATTLRHTAWSPRSHRHTDWIAFFSVRTAIFGWDYFRRCSHQNPRVGLLFRLFTPTSPGGINIRIFY